MLNWSRKTGNWPGSAHRVGVGVESSRERKEGLSLELRRKDAGVSGGKAEVTP